MKPALPIIFLVKISSEPKFSRLLRLKVSCLKIIENLLFSSISGSRSIDRLVGERSTVFGIFANSKMVAAAQALPADCQTQIVFPSQYPWLARPGRQKTTYHIRGSSNGRTTAFGVVNLGSNPGPRASNRKE